MRYVVLCLCAVISGSQAFGQLVGDVDGDGDVDQSDIPQLGTALVGPGGPDATGTDGVFDRPDDGDEKVTVDDAVTVQRRLSVPRALCDGKFGDLLGLPNRHYAGAKYSTPSAVITGSAAIIDRKTLKICTSMSDESAFTTVWTGVHDSETVIDDNSLAIKPKKWAQVGYHRFRNASDQFDPDQVLDKMYLEVSASGDGGVDPFYEIRFIDLQPFAREEFRCELINPAFGTWVFSFDSIQKASITTDLWENGRVENASYNAEMMNYWDFAPGSSGNHCKFDDCIYLQVGSPFDFPVDFQSPDGERILTDSTIHGAEITRSDRVEIWDKR